MPRVSCSSGVTDCKTQMQQYPKIVILAQALITYSNGKPTRLSYLADFTYSIR